MPLYSVFVLCVFPPPLSFYSSCILFSSVSMHAPLCATSSLSISLEDSIFGGPYMFDGTHFVWRAVYSEVSALGGMFLCFFVFLSLSCLRGWINFLFATRWSTPFRDHNPHSILYIPYSMLYVIYDLEVSNAVNPQVRNLFHVGKIYLPFCLVH
jgi:hypothetical protein